MDEIFGLIDSLEATILEGKKLPFSDKVILEEHKILELVDKIRLIIKTNGSIVKRSVDLTKRSESESIAQEMIEPKVVIPQTPTARAQSDKDLQEAKQEAEKIKAGAHEYADYVMANLQLLVTKMQTNLVKAEKTITDSRALLERNPKSPNEGRQS
ncbi:MAG: hypothetical protein EXS67_04295 [Candidatus Margulisbacteria bacterium]|nr:hypothetical protein [Candidatus Margulisiibacteriota bacterium]